jgi:hypothetical protein
LIALRTECALQPLQPGGEAGPSVYGDPPARREPSQTFGPRLPRGLSQRPRNVPAEPGCCYHCRPGPAEPTGTAGRHEQRLGGLPPRAHFSGERSAQRDHRIGPLLAQLSCRTGTQRPPGKGHTH